MSPASIPATAPGAVAHVVVLVDDHAALRTALAFNLELDGFVVRAFGSGEELLAAGLPEPPACLVFDYNLPGMNGLTLLQNLRDQGVGLPALLITSHPPRGLRDAVAQLGASIVEKPLLTDALARAIRAILAKDIAASA